MLSSKSFLSFVPMDSNEDTLTSTCAFIISRTDWFGGSPFQWNKSKSRVELKPHKKLSILRNKIFPFCMVYLAIANIQTILCWKGIVKNRVVKSYCLNYVGACIVGVPCAVATIHKSREVVQLFNAILDLNTRHSLEQLHSAAHTQFMYMMCKGISVSVYIIIPFALNFFANPCFPSHFGFWLSSQCISADEFGFLEENKYLDFKEFLGRLLILVTCGLEIVHVGSYIFMMLAFMFLKGYRIFCITKFYSRKISRIHLAQDLKLEFTSICKLYREIQILLVLFRESYSSTALAGFTCGGVLFQINGMYLGMGAFRAQNSQIHAFVIAISIWTTFALPAITMSFFGILGKVFMESQTASQMANRNVLLMRNKLVCKYIKSCPVLKIHFGSNNFVEPKTALAIETFVMQQTANLLVM